MAKFPMTLEAGTDDGVLAYSDSIYDKNEEESVEEVIQDLIGNVSTIESKYVKDVKVNGTSVVSNLVANIDISNRYKAVIENSDGTKVTLDNPESVDLTEYPDCVSLKFLSNGSFKLKSLNLTSGVRRLDLHNLDFSNMRKLPDFFLEDLIFILPLWWTTGNITDMSFSFELFSADINLDLSDLDTRNVTNMACMFNGASLSLLDLSNWDTSKVTDMLWMFQFCSSLTSLDLSAWDTSKVTDMCGMFSGCSSLTSLGDLSNWDVSKVTDMEGIFYQCYKLESLNLSGWDLSSCTLLDDYEIAFGGDYVLHNLILGEGFGKSTAKLTLDLSDVGKTATDKYAAYVLTDESWESFMKMYDRSGFSNIFTLKFKSEANMPTDFQSVMTARGYTIVLI